MKNKPKFKEGDRIEMQREYLPLGLIVGREEAVKREGLFFEVCSN